VRYSRETCSPAATFTVVPASRSGPPRTKGYGHLMRPRWPVGKKCLPQLLTSDLPSIATLAFTNKGSGDSQLTRHRTLIPVSVPSTTSTYRLSYEDRERIAYGLARRDSLSAIARRLGRSKLDDLARRSGPMEGKDLPGLFGPQSGLSHGEAPQGGQARPRAIGRSGHHLARVVVVSRENRESLAHRVPTRSDDARVTRDHLPEHLRPRPRRTAP